MDLNLHGKKVAVTGATGSFGQAFVKDLLHHGAIVYAIARSSKKLGELSKAFPPIIPVKCDISKWDETEKTLTEKIPDDLHMLINNVGVAIVETIENLSEDAVNEILNVNMKGTLCVTKVIAKKMMATGNGGSIVNISSKASDFPSPMLLTYSMTKAGLNRFTKTLATQLGPHNIRVNSINPTLIFDTAMGDYAFDTDEKRNAIKALTPLPYMPTMEDVSNTVLFYLSEKAKGHTGQIVYVDGGING